MSKQRYDLDGGLKAMRELIRKYAQNLKPLESFTPAKMFSKEGLGGLSLDREEAGNFEQVLTLLSPDEGQPRGISRATVGALIQEAVLISLDIHEKQKGTSLDDRITAAIKDLREKLKAPLVDWEVWRMVDRLKVPAEGFALGKVLFCDSNHQDAKKAKSRLVEILESTLNPPPPTSIPHYWPDSFSNHTLCRISVKAGDSTAAMQLSDGELHTTMAVLNFFASVVFDLTFLPVVCISDSLSSYDTTEVALTDSPTPSFSTSHTAHRFTAPFALEEFNGHVQVKAALEKVDTLLRDQGDIKFRDRLLTAVKWAGKAAASESRENSFLFYAIALESLLLGGKDDVQLSYKLRLRAAHLLGLNSKGRASIRDRVNRLYDLRSAMVHSGKTQIPEADLSSLRIITQSCIIHLLGTDKFKNIATDKVLEEWFENALMSGVDDAQALPSV